MTAVEDDITLDITQTREFFNDFKEELQMNRVRPPSLSRGAARVHRLVAGEKVSEEELIAAISMDPAKAASCCPRSTCGWSTPSLGGASSEDLFTLTYGLSTVLETRRYIVQVFN